MRCLRRLFANQSPKQTIKSVYGATTNREAKQSSSTSLSKREVATRQGTGEESRMWQTSWFLAAGGSSHKKCCDRDRRSVVLQYGKLE